MSAKPKSWPRGEYFRSCGHGHDDCSYRDGGPCSDQARKEVKVNPTKPSKEAVAAANSVMGRWGPTPLTPRARDLAAEAIDRHFAGLRADVKRIGDAGMDMVDELGQMTRERDRLKTFVKVVMENYDKCKNINTYSAMGTIQCVDVDAVRAIYNAHAALAGKQVTP